MADFAILEGPSLQQVLDQTFPLWHEGLTRANYGRLYAAQLATAWGRGHLHRAGLVDAGRVLVSAKVYRLDATLDGADVRIAGIGAVFTAPEARGRGCARELIERVLDQEAGDGTHGGNGGSAADGGAAMALLFSEIGPDYYARLGFEVVPTSDLSLKVIEDK